MSDKTTQVVPVVPLDDGRDDITVLRNRIEALEVENRSLREYATAADERLRRVQDEADRRTREVELCAGVQFGLQRKYEALVDGIRNTKRYDMKRGLLNPGIVSRAFSADGRHMDALAVLALLEDE